MGIGLIKYYVDEVIGWSVVFILVLIAAPFILIELIKEFKNG